MAPFDRQHVLALSINLRRFRIGGSMAQEKTGPDATPRMGLDLGRQIFDDQGGSDQDEKHRRASEDMIRQRAYELWENGGRTGDPQDHWYRAERELNETTQERSEATVENASPAAAAEAMGAVSVPTAAEEVVRKRSRSKRTT
jgi:hypothetical protein